MKEEKENEMITEGDEIIGLRNVNHNRMVEELNFNTVG